MWDVGLFHRTVLQAAWLGFQPCSRVMDLDRIAILLEYPHTTGGLVNARKAGVTLFIVEEEKLSR